MIWTPEADALLLELRASGKSMLRTAALMREAGYNVGTRNTIAGRSYRLRHGRAGYDQREREPRAMTEPKPTPEPVVVTIKPIEPVEPVSPLIGNRGVHYLTNRGCKALLDERGGQWNLPLCCGRKLMKDDGGVPTPYCKEHWHFYHHHSQPRSHHG